MALECMEIHGEILLGLTVIWIRPCLVIAKKRGKTGIQFN